MSWRERLRPASFRGVPFEVLAAEKMGGRRGETHEYPGRDEPYAEDAGRRARQYHVAAYLSGDDYDFAREALEDALEAEGPGTLVHPYYGTLRVVVRTYRTGHSSRQTNAAFFDIDFVEAGRNVAPVSATDTASVADEVATAAQDELEVTFADRFVADFPSFVTAAAVAAVETAADALAFLFSPVTSFAGDLDAFRRGILDVRASAGGLVQTPILLARKFRGLFNAYSDLPSSTREMFDGLMELAEVELEFDPIEELTSSRARERANELAIQGLLRRAALFEATRALPKVEVASRSDVIALRDRLEAAFEAEILVAGNDPAQDGELRQLEHAFAAAMRDLAARDDGTLARVRRITLQASQPALVIAHRLYQDAERDQEIVDRNRVAHPLLVPGGVSLEVLTSG